MENKKSRSFVKAISWRVSATLTTAIVVFIFTQKFDLLIKVGLVEASIKFGIYYLHERVWQKIKWGKHKK